MCPTLFGVVVLASGLGSVADEPQGGAYFRPTAYAQLGTAGASEDQPLPSSGATDPSSTVGSTSLPDSSGFVGVGNTGGVSTDLDIVSLGVSTPRLTPPTPSAPSAPVSGSASDYLTSGISRSTFSFFYDHVSSTRSQQLTSVEVAKQHVFAADPTANDATTGWRFDAAVDRVRFGGGHEVVGGMPLGAETGSSIKNATLRDFARQLRVSAYGTTGLRLMELEDRYEYAASGSILGGTSVTTDADHFLIGPQLGGGLVAESSIWRFEAVAVGVVGYQQARVTQAGRFGDITSPGALNQPAVPQNSSEATDDHGEVGWHVETRLASSCQFSQHWRLDATWRWHAGGPHYDAYEATLFSAPAFGIRDVGSESRSVMDWFVGVSYTR